MGDFANVHDITFGTGYTIYRDTILPAIQAAQHEVILVTCFWAPSDTRNAIKDTLLKLSSTAIQRGSEKVRVRIGFSSCSLWQKLLHTSAPAGRTYTPSEWTNKRLGLPAQEEIPGLDLQVKSIFFLPCSVWHPKFVVVDGREVFLPSCNVSWEDWLEGCVRLDGVVVQRFIDFWTDHWRGKGDLAPMTMQKKENLPGTTSVLGLSDVACKFLPSPHHRNPNFRFPWQQCAPAPKTPLNVELLNLFARATRTIYMQTPNVTCPPVLDALLRALERGVDVTIVTSEKLMILEQLVTAGTTTSRCIKNLVKKHQALLHTAPDEEAGITRVGCLHVSYYVPRMQRTAESAEPVQSHLKLTVVDEEVAVFGSGNMDRASWFTSQELGVAFCSKDLVTKAIQTLQPALQGRKKLVYDSSQA